MVPKLITFESKPTIPPRHILLLDISIDHDDSMIIFQDWSCKGNKFHDRVFQDPIHIGDYNYVYRKKSIKVGSVNHHIILIG